MFAVDLTPLTGHGLAERWRQLMPTVPEGMRAEMDEFGELFVSPRALNRHQLIAGSIANQLQQRLGGYGAAAELAILTRIGVRAPDAFWTLDPTAFMDDPAPSAPEICVEVASVGNTRKWLLDKAAAYLDAGAREVIIVEVDGHIRYFDANGERADSGFGLALQLPF